MRVDVNEKTYETMFTKVNGPEVTVSYDEKHGKCYLT